MADKDKDKDFPFIVLNGPKLNDPGARRIIRKQAMKDVGNARRRRGNYGKINQRYASHIMRKASLR